MHFLVTQMHCIELGEIKVGTKINRLEIKSNIDNKYRTQ